MGSLVAHDPNNLTIAMYIDCVVVFDPYKLSWQTKS